MMGTLEEKRRQTRDCLRRRKQRLKQAGLCQDCGHETPKEGRTLCSYCLESRKRTACVANGWTYHAPEVEPEHAVERMVALTDRRGKLLAGSAEPA